MDVPCALGAVIMIHTNIWSCAGTVLPHRASRYNDDTQSLLGTRSDPASSSQSVQMARIHRGAAPQRARLPLPNRWGEQSAEHQQEQGMMGISRLEAMWCAAG